MCTPLARSDYYETSAPPRGPQPATACPGPDWLPAPEGDRGWFPRSLDNRLTREVPSSCPGSIATTTPQFFIVASSPTALRGFGVDHRSGHALHPGPYPPGWSRFDRLRGFTTDSSRAPSRLACRTRTVWQYQHVPALSGPLPTLTDVPRIRLPSASTRLLRQPGGGVLSPPPGPQAPRGAPCRR
jgi:hypothetical protein